MGVTQDSSLKVRVYNIAHQNFDGHQDLGNCLLSQLVPDAAERTIAVKVDDDVLRATKNKDYNMQAYFSQLDNLNLGNFSEVLLASGGTVYMAQPEVVAQVRDQFFASQPDHCCRYGSLLVSSCKEGIASLDRPITVKIVDYEHENEMERKVAKDLRVGDCHGKISPRLAQMLGGKSNTPFESSLFESQGRRDCAAYIKDMLSAQGQDFEATIHPTKPCVVFAIENIAPQIKELFKPFNDPAIARHHDLIDLKEAKQTLFKQDRKLYNQLFTFTTANKKYNPVSITPPRHMNWAMGQSSRKASLVFSILSDRVTKALGQEISQVKLLGKDKNAYAQHDFDSNYYKGRELNFLVSAFEDPQSDRHGDPIVYMQNPGDNNYYSLGMFAKNSNKLPISASFTGQVLMDNKSVDLFVKPGSIVVPEQELAPSPKKQRSKARRREKARVQNLNKSKLSSLVNRWESNRQNSPKKKKVVTDIKFTAGLDKPQDEQLEI